MARAVFVDASAWVALTVPGDAHHRAAAAAHRSLLQEGRLLVTTTLVVAETHIAIRRAAGHLTALRFLRSLRESTRLEKVFSDAALEDAAEAILARYADQDFSLVDAVSFAVMRERDIGEAFAFDHHFLTAGFSLVPTPAH